MTQGDAMSHFPEPISHPSTLEGPALPPERVEELGHVLSLMGLTHEDHALEMLDRAFIHRSHRGETGGSHDNERLEFLGDSVIGLICTEYLLDRFPDGDEGTLSKMRASMVSRTVLGEVALRMDIGPLLKLGTGEDRSGGRERRSTLGSVLEAICGALYLHYPWSELRIAIVRHIVIPALRLTEDRVLHDYKSVLQEWSQKLGEGVPDYRVVDERGPEHERIFVVEAWLGDRLLGRGEGRRKKTAENEAAREAVSHLGLDEGMGPR